MIGELREMISRVLQLNSEIAESVLYSILIIAFLWFVRSMVLLLVFRRVDDARLQYLWKKNLTYIITFVGIFAVGRLWIDGFHSIATFLGILSAGIVFALREIVLDLAGWVYIVTRQPFELGDRIQIGDISGDVVDKRVLKFTLMEIGNWVDADQSTGRVVHVPNHHIFTRTISNYTTGFAFIWNEIPVRLTFESNWRKAKEILQKIAEKHASELTPEAARQIKETAKNYMIMYTVLTPIVYTDVKEYGIQLTMRYLTHPRRRRGSAQMIWEDVLTEFAKHNDIEFAYTTIRYFDHKQETTGLYPPPTKK